MVFLAEEGASCNSKIVELYFDGTIILAKGKEGNDMAGMREEYEEVEL